MRNTLTLAAWMFLYGHDLQEIADFLKEGIEVYLLSLVEEEV